MPTLQKINPPQENIIINFQKKYMIYIITLYKINNFNKSSNFPWITKRFFLKI